MNLQEALHHLQNGISVKLEDGGDDIILSGNESLDELMLDITVEQALSTEWQLHYSPQDYKEDMRKLADIFGRLTASGIQVKSNGEELREIETILPKDNKELGKLKPGFISNYNGKWSLK